MAQDDDASLPILSIIDGPNWDRLCEDLKGIDYNFEQPLFFKVTGIPSGVYLGTETLSRVGFGGKCTITGSWLNSGSDNEDSRTVVLEYSPHDRKGRVVSISV